MTSRADVEGMPDCDDRAILLAAFTIEQTADERIGWDNVIPMLFQLLRDDENPGVDNEACATPIYLHGEGDMSDLVAAFTTAVRDDDRIRANLTEETGRYLGLAMVHEVWLGPDKDDARVVRVITHRGQTFRIIHVRGEMAHASRGDLVVSNDPGIDHALHALHGALSDAHAQANTT